MKKEMMRIAHEITRLSVNELGGDYKVTFSSVLRSLWNALKMTKEYLRRVELVQFANRIKEKFASERAAAVEKASGIIEMHYSEYKNNYASCETVKGSYDKKNKTIKVYTGFAPVAKKSFNGLCPKCHTYCYGDCMAH